ncbi:hypothetical protein ABZP36_017256 [Zizania latifolia]
MATSDHSPGLRERSGGQRCSSASDGMQGPITFDLKSSAFDPKEKVWTRTLRRLFKVDAADYILSLCGDQALRELSSPGKSGSFFYLTSNDQYMIKTTKKAEVKIFLKMIQAYYNHVRSFENSLVTKFFGLHCVKLAGANQKKVHFVIMGNLFCSEYSIHRRFDLKDADMEDYGFEYSDDEPEEQDVDIENQYYNSKGMVETDPEGALAGFDQVVRMEPEKAEWGFKALKQTVKLYYRLGKYKEMMDAYREMLTYIKSAVTRNYSEKCINNIMDFVSGSASQNFSLLQDFYQTTLKALEEAKNERLWFKTNLKLCKIWFDMGEYGRMSKILKELHKSCQREDGSDDQKKGTQLLEVYAIEIQMYTETKNNKKLKELYQRALSIKSAIPHPRIMGIIRECGGKMHMAERQWAEAATDFFEAFKNYDEAGNPRRIQCLKYLVLANMLMESEVNPFDGQEAKPYKNDPEILAMTNLIAAYQKNDIMEFEMILKSNRRTIMDDPFIRNYIEDLLKNIRTQVLLKLIKPYTRIRIPFISQELNFPEKDVEQLLVSLILDNRIQGHIDQVNKLLERGDRSKGMRKYQAIDKWNTQLKSIYQTVSNRVG